MKKIIVLLSFLLISIIFISCSSNKEKLLIGSWKSIETKSNDAGMEFFNDGRLIDYKYDNNVKSVNVELRWSLKGEDLTLERKGDKGPETRTYKIVSLDDNALKLMGHVDRPSKKDTINLEIIDTVVIIEFTRVK